MSKTAMPDNFIHVLKKESVRSRNVEPPAEKSTAYQICELSGADFGILTSFIL